MNAARKTKVKEHVSPSRAKVEPVVDAGHPPKPNPVVELRALYSAGNNSGAITLANQLLAENPDQQEVLLILARVNNREQNWKKALEVWTHLHDANPQSLEPSLQIARIHQRNLEWSQALTAAQAVLKLQSDHLEALKICFTCFWKQGVHADAAATAIRILELGGTTEGSVTIKLASSLFDHGQPALAARLAAAMAKADPAASEASKILSRMLANMAADALAAHLEGYEDAAAEACRDILSVVPDHSRASEILGQIIRPTLLKAREAFKADLFDVAIEEYTNVLRINPEHVESNRALGRLGWKTQDYESAAKHWARLERLTPSDPEPPLQLARIYARTGDVEQAYLRFRALSSQGGPVAAEAELALANISRRLLRLAVISTRDGPLDEAYRLTILLRETQSGMEGLSGLIERLARISAREASNSFKAGDFAAAVVHAHRAHDLDAGGERQLTVLARSAHKVGDFKSAQYAWGKLHEMNPDAPEPLLQSARYHHRFKEYDKAVVACQSLLIIQPGHEEATRILEIASGVAAA